MEYVCIGPHIYVWKSAKGSFTLEDDMGKLSLLCLHRTQISQLQSFSLIFWRLMTIELF